MPPRRAPGLAAPALALLAALSIASCGGDTSDQADGADQAKAPRQSVATLGRQAFGPNPRARSGRVDGSIEITVKGVRGFTEPVRLSMSGPFRARPGRKLPDYAVDISIDDQGVGLVSAGERSFVVLGTTGYAVPAPIRRRLARSAARGHNGVTRMLGQFGIAPWRWETNKRIGATEQVDGRQTTRIDTGVDVGRFLRDMNTFAGVLSSLGVTRANGLPDEIPADARSVLVRSVKAAKGASWIATKDRVMRKAGLTIDFAIDRARRARVGGISSLKVVARVLVSDVGSAAAIEPPRRLEPFSSLQLAFDALAQSRR